MNWKNFDGMDLTLMIITVTLSIIFGGIIGGCNDNAQIREAVYTARQEDRMKMLKDREGSETKHEKKETNLMNVAKELTASNDFNPGINFYVSKVTARDGRKIHWCDNVGINAADASKGKVVSYRLTKDQVRVLSLHTNESYRKLGEYVLAKIEQYNAEVLEANEAEY